MSVQSPQGNRDELFHMLAYLSGHLDIVSSEDERAVNVLQEELARALRHEDLVSARNHFFSFESSDLFFPQAVAPRQRTRLAELADRSVADTTDPEFRVFVRDTPVRTTQMPGSVPEWAAGASVARTLGPYTGKDGRRFWFDFFRITRLVALYIQGRPDPAMLFNVALPKHFLDDTLPPVADPLPVYQLDPDSVWIDVRLLAENAPAGLFIGLKISSGTVTLSEPTQLVSDKLTLGTTTLASVTLDLDTGAAFVADPASPYGTDARNATLQLPERLVFHFSGGAGAIEAIGGDIAWNVYGHAASFRWSRQPAPTYDALLNRVLIPLDCSAERFEVIDCTSPFITVAGSAGIERSAWALPVARIDASRPSPAAGIGGVAICITRGLSVDWQGLRGGAVDLAHPWLLSDPGRINVTDLQAANAFCTQEYSLWKDGLNPFGSAVKLHYAKTFPFIYNSFADGNEAILAFAEANPLLDRPVTVTGRPFDIRSRDTAVFLAVNKAARLLYLYDDNILFDNYDPNKPKTPPALPLAMALRNALFKITSVNACLLFGALAEDMQHVESGVVFLTFGIHAYVPTLPDPYAANLGVLRAQFERVPEVTRSAVGGNNVLLWLVAQARWQPLAKDREKVEVSFHFAPLQDQLAIAAPAATDAPEGNGPRLAKARPTLTSSLAQLRLHPFVQLFATASGTVPVAPAGAGGAIPDYQALWNERFAFLRDEDFALLDVSSNASQMGVSFEWSGRRKITLLRTHGAGAVDEEASSTPVFPLQMRGLDVVGRSRDVRAFTVPIIAWEPVINLSAPEALKRDPPRPINYYPDDGGPTKIFNNSTRWVPLAPIPVCDMLVDAYDKEAGNVTSAYFTLPFGLRALAYLFKSHQPQKKKPVLTFNRPSFGGREGALQLRLTAGSGINRSEDDLFRGYAIQLNNVLDAGGNKTDTTTLGEDVAKIFNQDFFRAPGQIETQKGVPLRRIDVSGYGANTFSEWHYPDAKFAATSQARFDVVMGRTAHEVIQVKSIVYPWGIRVVRTITLYRVGSGYVYRVDSGWKAESDGRFDFTFEFVKDKNFPAASIPVVPYKIHPGTVKGLFNVQNIRTAVGDVKPFVGTMEVSGFYFVDKDIDRPMKSTGSMPAEPVDLQPVYFDADVELEDVIQGQVGRRVPGKKILGFVQLAPGGIPITPEAFRDLLLRQLGAIGGPLDCIMDIGKSGQKFRVNFVDVNASVTADGTTPAFVAAARGQVILPKDGSWSLVAHARGSGDVTPLPDNVSVPLIRIGELRPDLTVPDQALLRIAHPADLLRAPSAGTTNFGFLQNTSTQKVLFLTPAFARQTTDTFPGKLLSKTPPLFVDAYRLAGSKAVFPNIGDAEANYGTAIALTAGFAMSTWQDGGRQVLELLNISSADGVTRLPADGYKLANTIKQFDLPPGPWYLIDEDYLKIYVFYSTTLNGAQTRKGVLDYDVDSFAAAVEDRWKSRVSNIEMVVDLGPFSRLLTIKGSLDAKKGAEASYVGDPADPVNFPAPQMVLSDALEKAKDILQILAALQGGDYVDAFKRGLKIAMSNGADSWEYRLEASQEIPVLKFPPGVLANDPNAPLKLEASLKFGVYFNAAVTTAALSDLKKLLPTAGAFLEFDARLSVMCMSLSVATVYAVGQCNLRIAGDTGRGPSVEMKFGFGAQVVVGLPVVGNVSVLFVVGVEIYTDANKLAVSAFLLFEGHAELFGGLVSVTIMIEAKGSVVRIGDQTSCEAQVTFGLDISIFLVIDISFSTSWGEQRQIA